MLSNAYFLAKFRFDTAENEPAKNLQNFAKFANFASHADEHAHRRQVHQEDPEDRAADRGRRPGLHTRRLPASLTQPKPAAGSRLGSEKKNGRVLGSFLRLVFGCKKVGF